MVCSKLDRLEMEPGTCQSFRAVVCLVKIQNILKYLLQKNVQMSPLEVTDLLVRRVEVAVPVACYLVRIKVRKPIIIIFSFCDLGYCYCFGSFINHFCLIICRCSCLSTNFQRRVFNRKKTRPRQPDYPETSSSTK